MTLTRIKATSAEIRTRSKRTSTSSSQKRASAAASAVARAVGKANEFRDAINYVPWWKRLLGRKSS